MNTKWTHIVFILFTIGTFLAGIVALPFLPEQVASHWNTAGEVDGYMPKLWGTFLLPLLMVIVYGLYATIPLIDPLGRNIRAFRHYYNAFFLFLAAFFVYIFALMLAWNLGSRFDFGLMIVPALAVLFYAVGVVLNKSKRNWFFGIRTPWTLSSDVVWDKTHRLGGWIFKTIGIFLFFSVFLFNSETLFPLLIVLVVIGAVIPTVYSFVAYQSEKKRSPENE